MSCGAGQESHCAAGSAPPAAPPPVPPSLHCLAPATATAVRTSLPPLAHPAQSRSTALHHNTVWRARHRDRHRRRRLRWDWSSRGGCRRSYLTVPVSARYTPSKWARLHRPGTAWPRSPPADHWPARRTPAPTPSASAVGTTGTRPQGHCGNGASLV